MKWKPEMDRAELPKTEPLKQLTDLMREVQQQDVCDMEVNLIEVMRQELETLVGCLSAEEDDVEDIEMSGGELRDGSEGEEQEPMTDGEQREGSATVNAGYSKRDPEQSKETLMRLHVKLGHLGVKELIRALKHGRASELTIQEARRIRCDVCAENVQPELPRPAVPHQVLNFSERLGLVILSLPHWDGFTKSVKCVNIACHGTLFSDDHTALARNDCSGSAASVPRRLAALGTKNLHDLFLDLLELISVETEITAAESPWQPGIKEANRRAFKMVFK